MGVSAIGRRYERLLFFAGPLALLCLLALFVAFASSEQEDRKTAACFRYAASALKDNLEELSKAYAGSPKVSVFGHPVEDVGGGAFHYWLALRNMFIYIDTGRANCDAIRDDLVPRTPSNSIAAPKELISEAEKKAAELEGRPFRLYGVELPDKATIAAFGTPIKMDLITLVRALQVALGPILLLWLGSLYNTRHREVVAIAKMRDVSQLYPHLINLFPLLPGANRPSYSLRKKTWFGYWVITYGIPALFGLIRTTLLSFFVLPPVLFYLVSVYLIGAGTYSALFVGFSALVGLFTFTTLVGELFLWGVDKRFHGPA